MSTRQSAALPNARQIADEHSFARIGYAVLLDVYQQASADYWRRRAAQFEAARPRRGDFTGQATLEDLRERWDRLTDTAAACRARADFLDAAKTELDDALADLAAEGAA